MTLGHERLDVYRLSIDYVGWVFAEAKDLDGNYRHARDQWLRASQSIPLNIAEGNGKSTEADRCRYFEIARGSALECAAIQDVLMIGQALDARTHCRRKDHLDRIAAMLSKLAGRGYRLKEAAATYGTDGPDPDFDFDVSEQSGRWCDADTRQWLRRTGVLTCPECVRDLDRFRIRAG